MSGECDKCGEHCLECRCGKPPVTNYYMDLGAMADEVKVWAQMFFDDGSVTRGKYIPRDIYDSQKAIEDLARDFLQETSRKEGVLFIWGAGRVYGRTVQLRIAKKGTLGGLETLTLHKI